MGPHLLFCVTLRILFPCLHSCFPCNVYIGHLWLSFLLMQVLGSPSGTLLSFLVDSVILINLEVRVFVHMCSLVTA